MLSLLPSFRKLLFSFLHTDVIFVRYFSQGQNRGQAGVALYWCGGNQECVYWLWWHYADVVEITALLLAALIWWHCHWRGSDQENWLAVLLGLIYTGGINVYPMQVLCLPRYSCRQPHLWLLGCSGCRYTAGCSQSDSHNLGRVQRCSGALWLAAIVWWVSKAMFILVVGGGKTLQWSHPLNHSPFSW